MSAPVTLAISPEEKQKYAMERAAIDASCRGPVLALFCSALFWLAAGTILALIASTSLHAPEFFSDIFGYVPSWLTFGRVRGAHLSCVGLGWGATAAMGVNIWLMCRLSRAQLIYPKILYFAIGLFNAALLVGIIGSLAGYGEGVEWLEIPKIVTPFISLAAAIMATWSVLIFRKRKEKHVYVSQWYAFGGMFWLPWLYTTVVLLTLFIPATGVVQPIVGWWFGHNFIGLWLTPSAVGAAYYLIPKVIGRPVYSYYLSILGFWALALFYSWAGMHHLTGGPIPAWMVTASTVGSMMMFIPVSAVALNHHMTIMGHFKELRYSPTLRFVVFGALAYTCVSFQGSVEALRWYSEVAHFTHHTVGHAHLGGYGFFTMIMFGSMYYIVPRLTGWEWSSSRLIRIHFWCTSIGISIYFVGLSIGGWFQGLALINPNIEFISIVKYTRGFLASRTLGGSLIAIGHLAFIILFVMNLLRIGKARTQATYFQKKVVPGLAETKEPMEMVAS
jgi:cytochrome c oxidase cbb3-type subunit I